MNTLTLAALFAGSVLLAACGNSDSIGPSQKAPGPMGSTSTPSTADLPSKNSQSLPIDRPE
ncbi:hypothetical protein [Parvibaculum sp.]|uniref:hypothetical protein n=1 Tax=Parvibaculum sp. TaxID=2024848 RepID=UPI00391CFD68